MAKFTSSFIPADTSVNVNEIYEECLYKPTSFVSDDIDHTFEALNGGLTRANLASSLINSGDSDGATGLSAEQFRSGSFCRGYFYGFNFPDRYNESQYNQDAEAAASVFGPLNLQESVRPSKRFFNTSYSLSANVFIPWDSVVYVTYQGFFSQALVVSSSSNTLNDPARVDIGDESIHRLYVDGKYEKGTQTKTPASRENGEKNNEYQYRWHNKTKLLKLSKGYHTFDVLIYLFLQAHNKDSSIRVLDNLCGSISLVAIKAGKEKDSGILEWYGFDTNDLKGKTVR